MFSDKIRITVKKTGKSIELDQRRVQIRENQNGLMALSYVAPLFDIIDLERFFDELLSSEKLTMNIGDTGEAPVSFRGMIDGKGKILPDDLEHKIILLQEPTCFDRVNVQVKGFSKFKPRGKLSD